MANSGLTFHSNIVNQGDHIYYNISVINNTAQPQLATFAETRSQPLLSDPTQWHMSLVRFTIPTGLIPIFDFEDYTLNNNLSVSLSYSTTTIQTFLVYIPLYNGSLDYTDAVQPIYSYQQFLDMINTAFTTCYNALIAAQPECPATSAPYVAFDPTTQLCSIFFSNSYYNGGSDETSIYMSGYLYDYFGNWEVDFNGYGTANGLDVEFLYKSNPTIFPVPPTGYYQQIQDYPNMSLWYTGRSLQVVSDILPLNSELIPSTTGTDAQPFPTLGNNNNNTRSIITDFEFPLANGVPQLKPYVQYNANPYRLINMNSKTPLVQIGLQVYWTTNSNINSPLYIQPYDNMTMKIMFRKKSILSY